MLTMTSQQPMKSFNDTFLLPSKPHNQLFSKSQDFFLATDTDALILAAGDNFLFPLFRKQFNAET